MEFILQQFKEVVAATNEGRYTKKEQMNIASQMLKAGLKPREIIEKFEKAKYGDKYWFS